MLIGIISDTHDNLPNIDTALDHLRGRGVNVLIHAGDLAKTETAQYILDNFVGDIYLVGGNADFSIEDVIALAKNNPRLKYHACCNRFEIEGIKIALTHKPADGLKFAATGNFDLVIHGHDHKPWQVIINKTEVLNPGNLADTRYPATFAIYDTETKKPELIQIEKIRAHHT